MQYRVYRNKGNSRAYPYLVDVQSNLMDELNTRLIIPLLARKTFKGRPPSRLNPILVIEGEKYLAMTHEMASVRFSQLGEEVTSVEQDRQAIRNAVDFLMDGF